MFRALFAHHQESKLYYTASGIITPVGGRPVHTQCGGVHGMVTCRCNGTKCCI